MNDVKFKIGDKVVFCKSSLDSGMIDAQEGDVFTVSEFSEEHWGGVVRLQGVQGVISTSHIEHYTEKEKEVEKKFAKVGDKIRIVAAESTGDCYKNGDVLEVVTTYTSWGGVDVFIDDALGNFHVYHKEYEIVEDGQEDDFVFTEEHVGMEGDIMAKYIIEHSIEYYGNACSCCDPTPFDCYQVKDAETGQYFGYDDDYYGFIAQRYAYKEEALEAILEKLGVEVEYTYEEDSE